MKRSKYSLFSLIICILLFLPEAKALLGFSRTIIDAPNGVPATDCHEVQNMPPIKAQGNLNLCYAFSSSTLLEHYRCQRFNLVCNSSEQISPIDVGSRLSNDNEPSIKEQGAPSLLLKELSENSNKSFVSESCAPYGGLTLKRPLANGDASQRAWWSEMSSLYNSLHGGPLCNKGSLISDQFLSRANEVYSAALASPGVGAFLYRAAIPQVCRNPVSTKNVPEFRAFTFPEKPVFKNNPDDRDISLIAVQLKKLVSSNRLAEMSLCVVKDSNSNCQGNHSVVISGFKYIPNSAARGGCNFSLKVINSYGAQWQNANDNGWVDGCNFLRQAYQFPDGAKVNWIDSPNESRPSENANTSCKGTDPKAVSPVRAAPTFTPQSATDFTNEGAIEAPRLRAKKIYWKCQDGAYSDHPIPGKNCFQVGI